MSGVLVHGRKYRGSRWNWVASSLLLIIISISGFRGRHFEFGQRPTSGNVGDIDSVISKSGVVEYVEVAIEIVWACLSV